MTENLKPRGNNLSEINFPFCSPWKLRQSSTFQVFIAWFDLQISFPSAQTRLTASDTRWGKKLFHTSIRFSSSKVDPLCACLCLSLNPGSFGRSIIIPRNYAALWRAELRCLWPFWVRTLKQFDWAVNIYRRPIFKSLEVVSKLSTCDISRSLFLCTSAVGESTG